MNNALLMSHPLIQNLFRLDSREDLSFRNFLNVFDSSFVENENGTSTITVDVPGMTIDDVEVLVEKNSISIKGERKDKQKQNKIDAVFTVPSGYDPESLSAQLENGVLALTVAKLPPTKNESKKISIKSTKALS